MIKLVLEFSLRTFHELLYDRTKIKTPTLIIEIISIDGCSLNIVQKLSTTHENSL